MLDIKAWPLVAFHVPPVTRSDSVVDVVTQRFVAPVIVPAEGAVLTAMFVVVVAVPQELEIV